MDLPTAILAFIGLLVFTLYRAGNSPDKIKLPVLRKRGGFAELLTTFEFAVKGPRLLQDGYSRFKDTGYIFYTLGWRNVVLTRMEHVLQLRNESESVLCSNGYTDWLLQAKYTLPGQFEYQHGYAQLMPGKQRMVTVVKARLGNGEWMDTIWQEAGPALREQAEAFGVVDDGQWRSVETAAVSINIIARVVNRVLTGPKMCKDKQYLHVMCKFTEACAMTAEMLKLFPEFLRPVVHRLYNRTSWCYEAADSLLDELISDTFEKTRAGLVKPEDETFLQWIIARETKAENTLEWRKEMVRNIVLINLAGIHTTAIHLTKCLYELAAHPEDAAAIRQEVADKMSENGGVLDYPTLEKMWHLDSFIKEVQRLSPQTNASLSRLTMKPYTFTNGPSVPANCIIHVNGGAMARDDAYFLAATTFDGRRFLKLRAAAASDEEAAQFKFSATSPIMASFGDGRRTCPGRWLASMEVRCAVIRLLMEYDVELLDGGRPPVMAFGAVEMPEPKGRLMMRKRVEV